MQLGPQPTPTKEPQSKDWVIVFSFNILPELFRLPELIRGIPVARRV
jgi:hypothetical protein